MTSLQPLDPRGRRLLTAVAACSLLVAGCSTAPQAAPGGPSTSSAAAPGGRTRYPVTVTSCGSPLTFDRAPSRAVSNDVNTFESMVALGLTDRMVGTFGLSGFGSDGAKPVPAPYEAAYATVKAVSPEYVTLEPLVGLRPDFLFAGWNYGLKVGTTMTPDNLKKYGIATYALAESCAHVQKTKRAASIDDAYADLTTLGQVFDVNDTAKTVVDAMKATVADVQAKVAGRPAVPVFVYDSGTDAPFTAPGLAIPDNLIALAGGRNIFHDLAQTWTSVSWEEVVKADPACIVINDYGKPTYEQKKTFLRTNPVTRNLTAVTRGCFVRLGYDQLTPSPRNADAVRTIATALHPDAFR